MGPKAKQKRSALLNIPRPLQRRKNQNADVDVPQAKLGDGKIEQMPSSDSDIQPADDEHSDDDSARQKTVKTAQHKPKEPLKKATLTIMKDGLQSITVF